MGAATTHVMPRRVTVLGAGLSGRAAARLALRLGVERVTLTDLKADSEGVEGAHNVFGRHDDADLTDVDLVVVSPGVPAAAPPVRRALAAGVEVLGELGFAWRHLPRMPTAAITGTNGKSTVTHFTGQLLRGVGRRPFVGGNLGTPLCEAVGGDFDCLVVEVSSYQLELAGDFAPDAGVILNLTPDHLARHGTMEGYAAAKAKLFDHMTPSGLAYVPNGDILLKAACEGKPGQRRWLDGEPGVLLGDDGSFALIEGERLDLSGLKVMGRINRWNAAVAAALARALGASLGELDLSALTALPHRMQPVADQAGVLWINDSKATNVDAALVGLESVDRPAVVILGGQGKEGADYSLLRPALRKAAVEVIVCGGSAQEISQGLGAHPHHVVSGLADAVALARRLARPGQAVLLTPACASFDEFNNFEHRGAVFARLAQEATT